LVGHRPAAGSPEASSPAARRRLTGKERHVEGPAHYDVTIIGSGQAGSPLAEAFAGAGKRTALVEREHVGGTCVNVGCTPTKTMVASARVAYLARRAADYGVRTGPVSVDLAAVRQRKRNIVEEWRGGKQRRLEQTEHLDLLMGEARFTGPRSVEVALAGGGRRQLTADLVFINSGDRPATPPIDGLGDVPTLDSTSIMELDTVPDHLLVLGGGYVGLEFGQMFRRFGSRVTIVQRGPQLLGREDQDVAEAVAGILRQDGVEVLLDAEARRAERGAGGEVRLGIRVEGDERTLAGSHLLVAAGRVPNTDRLDLAAAGVETDQRGYVRVDERLETNVPGIYALGDVKGGPAFTHISYDDFRVVNANLLEGGQATTAGRLVPYTVYIDPQLGRVGLTEREVRAQGRHVKVARMPMENAARAEEVGETRGFMKAVVDADTGQILGCAVLGVEGGELMSMLEIAMLGKVPYPVLREAIFAHPTLAESLNNLFCTID
jgi:pyruvate/2-oxoglutarate dehydrogenase complex dihydrolipoamide dehydrogenase (E3) component